MGYTVNLECSQLYCRTRADAEAAAEKVKQHPEKLLSSGPSMDGPDPCISAGRRCLVQH